MVNFDLSARLTAEGKLRLYLRFAPLTEKFESVKIMIYQCNTINMKSDLIVFIFKDLTEKVSKELVRM